MTTDDTAISVLSGHRALATEWSELESSDGSPIPVASHRVGEFAAVLVVVPFGGAFDLDVCLAEVHPGSRGHWRSLGSGGITLQGDPITLAEGEFYVGFEASQDVSLEDRDLHLVGKSGWAPGGAIVARLGDRELDRIVVAPHGLFCFATCLPDGERAEYFNE